MGDRLTRARHQIDIGFTLGEAWHLIDVRLTDLQWIDIGLAINSLNRHWLGTGLAVDLRIGNGLELDLHGSEPDWHIGRDWIGT